MNVFHLLEVSVEHQGLHPLLAQKFPEQQQRFGLSGALNATLELNSEQLTALGCALAQELYYRAFPSIGWEHGIELPEDIKEAERADSRASFPDDPRAGEIDFEPVDIGGPMWEWMQCIPTLDPEDPTRFTFQYHLWWDWREEGFVNVQLSSEGPERVDPHDGKTNVVIRCQVLRIMDLGPQVFDESLAVLPLVLTMEQAAEADPEVFDRGEPCGYIEVAASPG